MPRGPLWRMPCTPAKFSSLFSISVLPYLAEGSPYPGQPSPGDCSLLLTASFLAALSPISLPKYYSSIQINSYILPKQNVIWR